MLTDKEKVSGLYTEENKKLTTLKQKIYKREQYLEIANDMCSMYKECDKCPYYLNETFGCEFVATYDNVYDAFYSQFFKGE